MDQRRAERKAYDDQRGEHEKANAAIDERRIGRSPQSGPVPDQPQPNRIASDGGGERLIEEGSNHRVAERIRRPQADAGTAGYLTPS